MINPKQHQYRVKRGDTLWHIAQHQYGDPTLWPEIAKANHIPDGNLILIGMHLKIPVAHGHHHAGSHPSQHVKGPPSFVPPVPPGLPPKPQHTVTAPILNAAHHTGGGSFPVARPVLFPAAKYKLDTLPAMTVSTPQADFKLKLIGEITVQQKGVMAEVEYSASGALSEKLKAEYQSKVAKIAGQVKVKWDPASLKAEMSCGFTVASKMNGTEFISQSYDYTPPNKFKYTLKPKEVSGEIENLVFKGTLGYELEITVKDTRNSSTLAPVPVRVPSRTIVWVTIGGLVVVGAVIIVADIVKDVGTFGAGTVESPLSWAAAMALFARAAAMAH